MGGHGPSPRRVSQAGFWRRFYQLTLPALDRRRIKAGYVSPMLMTLHFLCDPEMPLEAEKQQPLRLCSISASPEMASKSPEPKPGFTGLYDSPAAAGGHLERGSVSQNCYLYFKHCLTCSP